MVLSVFVNEERITKDQPIKIINNKTLIEIYHKLKEILLKMGKILKDVDPDDYDEEKLLEFLNPSMFKVIEMWFDGSTFLDITKKSNMFEGQIIRNIKRLYELLR